MFRRGFADSGWIFAVGAALLTAGTWLKCHQPEPVELVTLAAARAHAPVETSTGRLNPDQKDIAIAILQAALDRCETTNRPEAN